MPRIASTTSSSTNVKPELTPASNMFSFADYCAYRSCPIYITKVLTERIPMRIPMIMMAMTPPIPKMSAGSSRVERAFHLVLHFRFIDLSQLQQHGVETPRFLTHPHHLQGDRGKNTRV